MELPPVPSSNGPGRPSLVIPSNATILMAVHDFEARSPDELTLHKGEEVELLEGDEEFNDGWYLGRSLTTSEKGLFPRVYTTPTLNPGATMLASSAIVTPSPGSPSSFATVDPPILAPSSSSAAATTATPAAPPPPNNLPELQQSRSSPDSLLQTKTHSTDAAPATQTPTPPLTVEKGRSTPTPKNPTSTVRNGNVVEERTVNYVQGLHNPVVEDTLSDIEEALSEISKNRENRANKVMRDHNRRHSSSMPSTAPKNLSMPVEANDSSSEYSVQEPSVDAFGSDIDDEEQEGADEEREGLGSGYGDVNEVPYTKADVMKWTPADVSQYLQSRQIPPAACMKFEEQEVTGSILLQLEMSHLKELELGSFGKRFEIWKEIERLVKNLKRPVSKPRSGSDAAARHSVVGFIHETGYNRQRSSTVGTVLPRIRSQHNRPPSRQHKIDVQEANSYQHNPSPRTPLTATTISSEVSSPASPWERTRSPPRSPLYTSNISSSKRTSTSPHDSPATALNAAMSMGAAVLAVGGSNKVHHREESFDKTWTSGVEIASPQRSVSAAEMRESNTKHKITPSTGTGDSALTGESGFSESVHSPKQKESERTYFSSGETMPKERKVLKKNAQSRHSRIASAGAEAIRRTSVSTLSAALTYHKSTKKQKRKSASFSGDIGLSDYEEAKIKGIAEEGGFISSTASPATFVAVPYVGRSLSDTIKSTIEVPSPISPGTGSISTADGSTPSLTVTIDTDAIPDRSARVDRKKSKKSKEKKIRAVSSGSELRQKSKKQTTAFQKGLRTITPIEAAQGGDYSGWMKKRGSSGVGAWKLRFFVLNGRRLSYFYSESDTMEQGLIDITSHKVLPASDDRLVGLHAAIAAVASPAASPRTGASPLSHNVSSPDPPGTPTKEEKESPTPSKKKEKDQGWFTFKLVPPAPGAAKGVTFTQPRLHYFATDTREEGKKWMAAMMKATIDRDETKPVITSYNAKTISLSKARELRARPPGLLNKEEGLGIEMGLLGISVADIGEEADVEDEGGAKTDIKSVVEDDQLIEVDEHESYTTIIDESEPEETDHVIDHAMFERQPSPNIAVDEKAAGLLQVKAIGIMG